MACSMSDHVSKLTSNLLELELVKVTKWDQLGLYLGLKMADIEEIELNHQDLFRRRMAMFEKWIRKEGNASWMMVVEALEKMSELALASQLRKKYCTQQCTDDEKPQMGRCEEPQADLQTTERVLKMDRKETVATELERLEEEYFHLVFNTESAVAEANPPVIKLKRFSEYYCNTSTEVRTVEELFDYLKLCFLDTALLQKIISIFLGKIHSLNCEIVNYIQQLEDFKRSTTLKKFMESIEAAQKPLTTSETPRTCTVTLKLVGDWLEKTITDLDKLLKVLFQDKSSVLTHLKIERGSVIITYLVPQSEAAFLILIALHSLYFISRPRNISFMTMVGVCALQIGNALFPSTLSETSDFSFESSLIDAVINDNIDILSFLLDINTSPDAASAKYDRYTALIVGSHFARKKAVELLLKANANINIQAENGITPLYAASSNGHSDIVSVLLKANADPNIQVNDGATPLIIASQRGHFNVVSILLENNADPNHQAVIGGTPLYTASCEGHTKIVDLLLKANAEPNIQEKSGNTPLHTASGKGHDEVVDLLLKANANPNLQGDKGMTPLYIASSSGHSDTVSLLLKANADLNIQTIDSATPLIIASQNGHFNVVSLLLENNADPNLQVRNGVTSLYTASVNGHTKIVDHLLRANAKPNIQEKSGETPIFLACLEGHDDVVDVLLKANANPNLQTENGITPLYAASCRGHTDVVSMLLKANADPNLQSNDGTTPLLIASQEGHFNVVNLLLINNADPNHQIGDGRTPLYTASCRGHTKIVDLLLKANADPSLQARDGGTPLMLACLKSHPQIVQLLLTSGADPNLQRSSGYTALMCACQVGCLESVELLLTNGADPSLQTPNGLTALDVAASKGYEDIVDLIQKKESSSTSPVLTANEIAANLDNETLNILNKAMEKMLVEKTESFIFAQYKALDKILPSKVHNLRKYLFNV